MEHNIIVISPDNTVGNKDEVLLTPIARALRNPAFAQQLAISMASPIRRNLSYQGIAHKVFAIEPLPMPDYSFDFSREIK